ncbi:hypothetical protein KAR04_00065 [Candidatus Calescamantes bacterium]|nr:hypothetical protein [Candidatus Calescamantes bacterium]
MKKGEIMDKKGNIRKKMQITSRKTDKKVMKGILWILGIFVGLLILIALIGELSDRIGKASLRPYRKRFDAYLEKYQETVKNNSMGQYEDESDENAWDHYSNGNFAEFASSKSIILAAYDKTELSEDIISEMKKYSGLEESIFKGAKCKYCHIPFNFKDQINARFPKIVVLKQTTKYMSVLAKYYLNNGKNEEALEVLKAGFILSADLPKGFPTLISEMIKTACDSILLSAVECGISKESFRGAELQEISKMLRSEHGKNIAETVYFEQLQMVYIVENTSCIELIDVMSMSSRGDRGTPNFLRQMYEYFSFRLLFIKTGFSPFMSLANGYEPITELYEKIKNAKWNDIYTEQSKYEKEILKSMIWRIIYPGLDYVYLKFLATDQRMKLVDIAAQLKKYKGEKGEYPRDLNVLGLDPEILLDNMSGAPIVYEILEAGKIKLGIDIEKATIPDENPYKKAFKYFEPIILN